jgi:hypothetical protein
MINFWNIVLFLCFGAAYLDTVPATQTEDQHQYVITLETFEVSENGIGQWECRLVAARNFM